VGLIECFFLGKQNLDMAVSFAIVDLLNYIQPYLFILLDIVEPVIQFASKFTPNDLIQNFLRHQLSYIILFLQLINI
jgi:hypothetical protein